MIVREELGTCAADELLQPTSATGITTTLEKPTTGVYAGKIATAIVITVKSFPINWRISGSAATAADVGGSRLDPGQDLTIVGGVNVINFSCIDTAAGASKVFVHVFY
jgi:hypothetical protein